MDEDLRFGTVRVIKRNNKDGPGFPLTEPIKIGRNKDCGIRVRLNSVSRLHAEMDIEETGQVCSAHVLARRFPVICVYFAR